MKNNICLIYNFAQHYRLGVFKLLDRKLNVDFYFGDKMDDVKKLNYDELCGFKGELKNINVISNFYWQFGAVELLFKKRYTSYILLGEYYCLSTWMILIMSFFSKKKIYLWSHGWYGKENWIIRKIKKLFFNLSDGVFLYGDYAKNLMIKEGFDRNKLHVIYNSLDYERQIEIRQNLDISSNIYQIHFNNLDPVLFFIGRLTAVKKLDMVIDAIHLLHNQGVKVNLTIIGDGDQLDFLKSKVANLGLNERVWFVGALYDELNIAKHVYNADLCVSPGNVGLTAMHVLMYGTPVITHNDFSHQMPEFEAIKSGETGLFFERDNVNDLCAKIVDWFTGKYDRQNVRRNCFRVIDAHFNPNYQYEVISSVLKK